MSYILAKKGGKFPKVIVPIVNRNNFVLANNCIRKSLKREKFEKHT
jgi:hypothetical protein